MKQEQIEQLRYLSRKLVRELGILQLDNADYSVSPGHWHALIEIDKEPGMTISKLGNSLLMRASKISRICNSLLKNGLIEIKAGPDKREKFLHITKAGKNAVTNIDDFSRTKIEGAYQFLKDSDMHDIINSIEKYSNALEKNRLFSNQIKISTLSTSRLIRKQIISMISEIQKEEFAIPITQDTNICILKAEQTFYYNHSCNFWYAVNEEGKIIGSIGLKKINKTKGEIKKFFVLKDYRGKGIAHKLMNVLANAALKHGFKSLYLGTVDTLKAAHKFYTKYGFRKLNYKSLPKEFELCELDSVFFECKIDDLIKHCDQGNQIQL